VQGWIIAPTRCCGSPVVRMSMSSACGNSIFMAMALVLAGCAGASGRSEDPWGEEPLPPVGPPPGGNAGTYHSDDTTLGRRGTTAADAPTDESAPLPPGCAAAMATMAEGGEQRCVALEEGRVVTVVLDDQTGEPAEDLPLHVALVEADRVVSQSSRNWVTDLPRRMRWILGAVFESELAVDVVELGGRTVLRVDFEVTYAREEEANHLAVFTALYEVRTDVVAYLWSGVTEDVREGLRQTCRERTSVDVDIDRGRLLLSTRTGSCESLGRPRVRRIRLPSD